MSCPNWSLLTAARERGDRGAADPAGWAEAMAHFDACAACRRDAVAADPLLVFRRLPAVELTPAEESAEVASMRQAVTAMRTARRIEARRGFAGWRRWAAAAVLALASLGVGRDMEPRPERAAAFSAAPAAAPDSSAPELEGLNRPGARVYHLGSDVLMIVDESLGLDV
ncbi:MAG TPA: hypothetical protein VKK31_25580 [Thermoanaerobaculia bacterium]|nr:hypothetical protein [Thermoanaerobaculia bacterium]